MSERYAVIEGSQSSHCCFEATVVDTTKPAVIGGDGEYEPVCECFDSDNAKTIAAALNEAEKRQ